MNADEASGRDGMNLAGKGLDLGQCGGRRFAAAREHDHVGLTDRLARPGRGVAAAEINHQRRGVFELVEPFGDFVCIERAAGKHRLEAGGVDNLGIDRGEPLAYPAIESARQRLQAAVDQRHGARLRRGGEWRDARGLLGEPPRQRSQQRLDDGGGFLDQLLVGRARQCQHAGVADGDHIGRARDIGEEADLAHQFAGPKLGDRFAIAGLAYRQRTMQHQEKRIRRPALRDQHLPAHQILADHGVERLQPLFGTERSKQREFLQSGAPRKYRTRSTHWRYPVEFSGPTLAPGPHHRERYKGRGRAHRSNTPGVKRLTDALQHGRCIRPCSTPPTGRDCSRREWDGSAGRSARPPRHADSRTGRRNGSRHR